jgi:L-lactate utilization protein LutB
MIERTVANLEKHNFIVHHVKTAAEARRLVLSLIPAGSTVGLGGSMTVQQSGILEALRKGGYKLFDQYEAGISREENMRRRREGMLAQFYVTGVNAISEAGELFYLDGIGNRVAAVSFGPEKVIVVASVKKIVPDEEAAWKRIREKAGPPNAARFGADVPCVEAGRCVDCESANRICNVYVKIHRQWTKGRFYVILLDEEFGF